MKVTVNGEVFEVPHKDDLDIDEMIDVEKVVGLPGPRWETEGGFALLKALVWIGMRRVNPKFGYQDARFKLSDLDVEEGELEELGKDSAK